MLRARYDFGEECRVPPFASERYALDRSERTCRSISLKVVTARGGIKRIAEHDNTDRIVTLRDLEPSANHGRVETGDLAYQQSQEFGPKCDISRGSSEIM